MNNDKNNINEVMEEYNTAKETLATIQYSIDTFFTMNYNLNFNKLCKTYNNLYCKKKMDEEGINNTIHNMDESEFNELFELISNNCLTSVVYKDSFKSLIYEQSEESVSSADMMIKILEECAENQKELNELSSLIDELDTSITEANNEYFNYINSKEYIERKQQEVDTLKSKLDVLEGKDKTKTEKMINTIESCINGTSIFNRIIDDCGIVNESEVKSIVRSFFDTNSSVIIMNKFISKCKKLGLSSDMYKSFFNIEEIISNTTGCDLYCYNNIILFHWMRLVAYCNPEDKNDNMIISEIIKFMIKIVYNKYPNNEDRERVVNNVIRFCNIFDDCGFREKFTEANKLSPKHEARRKSDLERKSKYLTEYNELISKYNNINNEESLEEMEISDTERLTVEQLYRKLCELQQKIDKYSSLENE